MTATNPEICVLAGPEQVAERAAEIFAALAEDAWGAKEDLRVALSGGSTPRILYRLLASDRYRERVPWERVRFFFGDERWIPHDHLDSNYRLANDELFSKVGVPPENVFPMPTEDLSPEQAAELYETTLRREFGWDDMPGFDLIFLGMGDDGHTASLFPHTGVLREKEKLVAAHHVEKLDADRITLTPPVLNTARRVLFMVAGKSKAPALREVLQGEYNLQEYPSQLLRKAGGQVTWLIDKEAASGLGQ